MSTGLIVRHDGSVGPCCSSLVDQRSGHPFQYAPASEQGLVAAHEAWLGDPLLRLVRAVGFEPLLAWLREEHPGHPLLEATPRHPCDVCVALWRIPGVAAAMARRSQQPATRQKIDAVFSAVFGDGPGDGGAALTQEGT
jgi:hypothetical protein